MSDDNTQYYGPRSRYYEPKVFAPGELRTAIQNAVSQLSPPQGIPQLSIEHELPDGGRRVQSPAPYEALESICDLGVKDEDVRVTVFVDFIGTVDGSSFNLGVTGSSIHIDVTAQTSEREQQMYEVLSSELALTEEPRKSRSQVAAEWAEIFTEGVRAVQREERAKHGPEPFNLYNFHPAVVTAAESLFRDGHHSQAVLRTFIALNNAVQVRSDRPHLDGTGLMQKVFSPNNGPILQVAGGNDKQLGAMWLFSGAIMAVRNPLAHNADESLTADMALEWLAFASALFRLLDDAQKVG